MLTATNEVVSTGTFWITFIPFSSDTYQSIL